MSQESGSKVDSKLFVLSAASLFLEILLIRWVSTEIRVFAYFRNLALIACFLGLGFGFATTFSYKSLKGTILTALLFVLMIKTPFVPENRHLAARITGYLSFDDFFLWGPATDYSVLSRAVLGLGMMLLLFGMIAYMFVPIGRCLGTLFRLSPRRIRAYSINVAGSLAGIWLFSLLSWLSVPPQYWLPAGFVLLLPGTAPRRSETALLFFAAAVSFFSVRAVKADIPPMPVGDGMIAFPAGERRTVWSPYQKLTIRKFELRRREGGDPVEFRIVRVNNSFYQYVYDLSPRYIRDHRDFYPKESERLSYDYYNIPYRFHPSPERILVVGAGTGNDVAAALRNTDAHIDAVEIDPMILEFGRRYHPEKPYASGRVTTVLDDARSYLKKNDTKYDMILYGLLDSHTLSSNFSNIGLDNYVYTVESFREAKAHLKPGGIIVLAFAVRRPWIGERISKVLEEAFGAPPMAFNCYNPFYRGTGGEVFLAGSRATVESALDADPLLRRYVESGRLRYGGSIRPTRDDWPYLWLRSPTIPTLHILVLVALSIASITGARFVFGRRKGIDGQFFFLGAAFLLLEVHTISKLMLLFGSTWIVNSIVISGVLLMILAANIYVTYVEVRGLTPYYAGLFLTLLATWALPMGSLFVTGYLARGVLAGAIFTVPLFFAGVIFATSLERCDDVALAFGSNLLGAILGGMSEVLSFVLGIRALLLVALFLYAAAYFFLLRGGAGAGAKAAVARARAR